MAVSWQELLEQADSEPKVINVVRDYMATLEPSEIARLPESCRPPHLFSAIDVSVYALALVRHQSATYDDTSALFSRIAAFLVHANMRLAQLLRTNDEGTNFEQSA